MIMNNKIIGIFLALFAALFYALSTPFSKILLGWVTPIVVTKDMSIELSQFPSTGECLLILDKFNNNYFDE